MTILDCLFYAFDSLSWDVSLEDIAKLVVAWLYIAIINHLKHLSEVSNEHQKCFYVEIRMETVSYLDKLTSLAP